MMKMIDFTPAEEKLNMNCEPCGKSFSGIVPYQQHLESEKHKKKISTLNFFKGESSGPTKIIENIPAVKRNLIDCPACNLSFDSVWLFQNHSLSIEHVNNVTKKRFEVDSTETNSVSNTAESVEKSTESVNNIDELLNKISELVNNRDASVSINTESVSSTTQADALLSVPICNQILPSLESSSSASFNECKVCNKMFSGPEPFRQHLASAGHKKKIEMLNNFGNPISGVIMKFECEPCKKVFSGHIPLQQHLASDIHSKKLRQLELLKNFTDQKIGTDFSKMEVDNIKTSSDDPKTMPARPSWFCAVCLVQCSGPEPYDQHINGDTHSKNLKKLEIQSSSPSSKTGIGICVKQDQSLESLSNNPPTFASPLLNVGVRNSMDVDSDSILPDAIQAQCVLQPKDLNIKEFMPEDKIDFNVGFENVITDEKEAKNMSNGGDIMPCKKSNETSADCQSLVAISENQPSQNGGNEDVTMREFEKCDLCNVELKSTKETLLHYESIEHVKKKYPFVAELQGF